MTSFIIFAFVLFILRTGHVCTQYHRVRTSAWLGALLANGGIALWAGYLLFA